jgi:DNA invertase Pin-like site-specific DNA recombinase
MRVGYARVSTDGQSVDAQLQLLHQAGCERTFHETASGAKTARTQLRRCLSSLRPGDVLYVVRLDRLARSTCDLLNILADVVERRAEFKSLNDTWADTTTPHGRLMLTVLGGLAEFERELIKARTSEGRKQAQARGVKFGPKFKLTPAQRTYVAHRRAVGDSVRQLALILGVSKATIARVPLVGILQIPDE